MFSNKSTDDLLANLEDDLTEVIELSSPRKLFSEVIQIEEKFEIEKETELEKEIFVAGETMPPIPAKRNLSDSTNSLANPVPAARRLAKRDKNNENEIIQLSSMSSSSVSENQRNTSLNTVVVASAKNAKPFASNIVEVHQSEKITEEKFFVAKRGKWAEDEKKTEMIAETEVHNPLALAVDKIDLPKSPKLEMVSEKRPKKQPKSRETPSISSTTQTSFESSSESSPTSEVSASPKKKSKKRKQRDKKKSKKQQSSEDQASSTEASSKEDKSKLPSQAIGIFLRSTGSLKYDAVFKSLKVKVSLFNEDSGKQIGDIVISRIGSFNNDFHNLTCTWNEMLIFEQDLNRLKEIYNNILVFFEVTNANEVEVCWAFMKLFSQTSDNVNEKLKLQFFFYQKLKREAFFSSLLRKKNQTDVTVFDQWRMVERKKFPGVLNVSIKAMNQKIDAEPVEELTALDKLALMESANRRWQKLPGQACKVPNKIFHKTQFREKGSMVAKFSQDGHLIAFNEVTKSGSIIHVQKFPEMQEIFTMLEHSDLIHDIDWLKQKQSLFDCQWLLTGSSDFTAIVWKIEASSYTYNILPHPSFVYASKFLQSEDISKLQAVTAGRDCVIRIWQSRSKRDGFELSQELKHPKANKSLYVTAIATRNSEAFYTSSSNGDVIEWMLGHDKDYHLSRQFKLSEICGSIITSLELHPRGNKIFLRVQDFLNNDNTNTIFIVGVSTGQITQRHQQQSVENESQGKLKITPCGSLLFSSNGSLIRFYSLANGALTSSEKNFLQIKIPSSEKFFGFDYHPKDFFLTCSIYGPSGGLVIFKHESETSGKDLFDKLRTDSNLIAVPQPQIPKTTNTHFSDIIRKLDEVFLTPIERDDSKRNDVIAERNENSRSLASNRSRTYTVSQGPATYTIQRSENNTYDIQRKDESEDDTTISESFN